ncbi:hypothetical protein BE21_02480 [Sorangium cellulosum]|uniref:Uncharacterized protein n=1 Tax=Sorangium cellulosum TaxID=56 RepID=A0A150TRW9_SORCE|nr:hypothetical protein BE21_02480 [Sorangium cellulosum]
MAKNASRFWRWSAEQAVALLKLEYSYIVADRASRLTSGVGLVRNEDHARWLKSIPGDYGFQLGVLLAAAPASKRAAIKSGFAQVLSTEQAATMFGVADGTEFIFDVRVVGAACFAPRDPVHLDAADGNGRRVLAFTRRTWADFETAQALKGELEREAIAAGAEDVFVHVMAA